MYVCVFRARKVDEVSCVQTCPMCTVYTCIYLYKYRVCSCTCKCVCGLLYVCTDNALMESARFFVQKVYMYVV